MLGRGRADNTLGRTTPITCSSLQVEQVLKRASSQFSQSEYKYVVLTHLRTSLRSVLLCLDTKHLCCALHCAPLTLSTTCRCKQYFRQVVVVSFRTFYKVHQHLLIASTSVYYYSPLDAKLNYYKGDGEGSKPSFSS
jgi:hypothetical protein